MIASPFNPLASKLNRLTKSVALYYDRIRGRSFALNELDKKLLSIIGKRDGFFIEAGANDGRSQSNTLLLERYRGWNGLLVEPIPELFERCQLNRPNCHIYQSALVPLDYIDNSIEIHFCGLMSTVVGALGCEEAVAQHIALGCQHQNLQAYKTEVPAKPLSKILDEIGVDQVDLLSLDVEGFEASALLGIDFQRHAPTYILVEERFPEQVAPILLPRYKLISQLSFHDNLYVLRSS